jgi:DNA-binding XRE family transcriptional regulator
MANKKTEEKSLCLEFFLNTSRSQKEIALLVGVTEKTLSGWIKEENWDSLKLAKQTTQSQSIENLRELLSNCIKQSREKQKEGTFTKSDADAILELTKSLDSLQGLIPLRVYVQVMEEFMHSIPSKHDKTKRMIAQYQTDFLLKLSK